MAARKPKKKKDTSFATWKFELENTVNADPLTDGACLQVLRAYLDFMGDAHDRPFLSICNLKVATALHEGAIVRARKKLIALGYFVKAGYTSAGATRFQILNSRFNIVLDHQTIARETFKRLEAEKKEKERSKRKSSADRSAEIAGDTGSADIAGLNGKRVCGNRRDRSADIADESVENTVEAISTEREGSFSTPPLDVQTSYSLAHSGDEANEPLPVPDSTYEAECMIATICEGYSVLPVIQKRMTSMLMAGVLTPNMATGMIGARKEEAA